MRILKSSKHGWQRWISRLPPLNKQRVKQRSPLGAHRCAPTGSDGIPSNTVRLNDDISISHPGLPGSQALDLLMVGLGSRSESTRLNSSHVKISYAVFCLKKKNIKCH